METDMDLDLGGIFLQNSTFNYENYDYNENYPSEDCSRVHFGTVLLPVFYSLTLVLGLLGNGLVLVVLVKRRRSWSVTDTFILHLAVADTLLLLTLPLWAAQAAAGWSFGTPLCKITGAMFKINFYCGIFLLTCISLDRYLSVVHAVQMYSRRKPWMVQVSCLSVWLLSILLSIPDWLFLESVSDTRQEKAECIQNYPISSQSGFAWRLASRLLCHILGFLLPSAVLIFCYSYILVRLLHGSQGAQKQRAVRVILALVLVFFLCWTPYNITLMVDTLHGTPVEGSFEKGTIALKNSLAITFAVACLHTCLNPMLYLGLCRNFCHHVLHMVMCSTGVQGVPRISLWDSGIVEDSPGQAEENVQLDQVTRMGQVQSPQN
ncbi:C-X-C chemokine receptor type 3-like isoform X2 [Esox lucius]|uniref:G-protein coupled receptors family 1 profile domain-containing protein n=1 Tax=Esox lucius TaxID=8010 RepID=A0AAY5KAA4_ESOLU|nr:C-X-C chemokine receptor type 3-like isoform X2 [Esox lucius]XP_034145068.1 C-X-C chemokine receptor type 3-like isoform X2 [Esox lucius]